MGCYRKADIDNMLLSYSTGSYVDYSLASKVSTTGDATISGNLEVQRLFITSTTAGPFEINNILHNGPYLLAISQNNSNNYFLFAWRCRPLNQLWCFGVAASNQYIISHGNSTKLSIQPNGNTSISGDLDVGKVLTLQRITGVTDTPPLKINNSSNSGWTVGQFESTLNNIGCLVEYKTFASSTSWWTGVWGTNTYEFKVWFNYKGLSIKPTGDVVISCNSDVNASNAPSSIKAYVTMGGYTSYIESEAKWNSSGYLNFESNRPGGHYVFITVKDDLHMYCGNSLVHFTKLQSMFQMADLKKTNYL